jgi:hypothetical protein
MVPRLHRHRLLLSALHRLKGRKAKRQSRIFKGSDLASSTVVVLVENADAASVGAYGLRCLFSGAGKPARVTGRLPDTVFAVVLTCANVDPAGDTPILKVVGWRGESG